MVASFGGTRFGCAGWWWVLEHSSQPSRWRGSRSAPARQTTNDEPLTEYMMYGVRSTGYGAHKRPTSHTRLSLSPVHARDLERLPA
jgi:hypothetical protein